MKRAVCSTLAAVTAVAGSFLGGQSLVSAAPPVVFPNDGAFIRVLGTPADGTVKFQFGWEDESAASAAVGYWIGVYDVTNSHYESQYATCEGDLPDEFTRNAKPTSDLPNGEYKIVFFVRGTCEPATNLAEIEWPFTVTNSDA
jgi:hypothetical protein